jgi:hypothetical protein
MTEPAARDEFERILQEEPGTGFGGRTIRVGQTAAFRSEDFLRIEIQDAPDY